MASWLIQALSSQMSGCSAPSLRTPSVFAHSWSRAYFTAPSSCQLCEMKPSTSPRLAGFVLRWRPESVELLRSAAVSALSGSARKRFPPSSSALAAAPPPMSAAMHAASCSFVFFAPMFPR